MEFPEISVEVDLYVVSPDCINAPVLLGTDVLNRKGVVYIRNNESQKITRLDAFPRVLHVSTVEVDKVKTPLVGEDRDRLMSIINEFASSFVSGTATSTVNTGSMEIKLTSETPVCYRPYKLSVDKKSRVRDIVDDLMAKGIIRESQSQYASPIILVKKKDGSDRMCVDYRALNAFVEISVALTWLLDFIKCHLKMRIL